MAVYSDHSIVSALTTIAEVLSAVNRTQDQQPQAQQLQQAILRSPPPPVPLPRDDAAADGYIAVLCCALQFTVYHANTVCRRSDVIKRRVYSSPHSNAVWHIVGNHKMIRWRLVIHAGVDGFSCCVVYINCAPTVMDAYLEGVSEYGTPARIIMF